MFFPILAPSKHSIWQDRKLSIQSEESLLQKIARMMRDYVNEDVLRQKFVKEKIGSFDIYQYFLEEILEEVPSQEYETIVMIDRVTDKIREACGILKPEPKIIEFKTFVRERTGPEVHIHFFELQFRALPKKKPLEVVKKKLETDSVPHRGLRIPILEALIEMGGKGKVSDVLKRVEGKMKNKLGRADYQRLETGEVRWRNRARWERLNMVNEGLLRSDSPQGFWEATSKGRDFYNSMST